MATASSLRFRILARIGGRAAAGSLILLSSVVFAAEPARADCDVLDPTCVVETVDDTVDSATETIDDTTGEAEETIDETVEDTTETIDDTTDEAEETVDETVGSGSGPVDDVIESLQPTLTGSDPVPPRTVDPAPSAHDGAGNGSSGSGSGGNGTSPRGGLVRTEPGGVAGSFVQNPASAEAAPAVEGTPVPAGFLDELLGPAGEIASRIAFPLGLALLVFLFVSFQNRLDRRDPKLALAATSPDVLRFG
jgi:hypothetical protein